MSTFVEFAVNHDDPNGEERVLIAPDLVVALHAQSSGWFLSIAAECIGGSTIEVWRASVGEYVSGPPEVMDRMKRHHDAQQVAMDRALARIRDAIDAHKTPWGVTIVRADA